MYSIDFNLAFCLVNLLVFKFQMSEINGSPVETVLSLFLDTQVLRDSDLYIDFSL